AASACTAAPVWLVSRIVLASQPLCGSARKAVNAPSAHCCPASHVTPDAAGRTPTVCCASRASDCRQTPSYWGSLVPYRPSGSFGDADGAAESAYAAGAAAPSRAAVASAGAARRARTASRGALGAMVAIGSVCLSGVAGALVRAPSGAPARPAEAESMGEGRRRFSTGFPRSGTNEAVPHTLTGGRIGAAAVPGLRPPRTASGPTPPPARPAPASPGDGHAPRPPRRRWSGRRRGSVP